MFCELGISDAIDREPQFLGSSVAENAPPSFHEYPVSDISVKNEVSLENFCCTFCRETGLHGNFGVRMNLGRHRTALQDFPSKLYFCGHKNPFRLHKSDLPNATASEQIFIAVSPCEKKVW